MSVKFPDQKTLEGALLRALAALGGQGRNDSIDDFVIRDLDLSESQRLVVRGDGRSEIQYRLAWVRTKAKSKGLIERIGPAKWRLCESQK